MLSIEEVPGIFFILVNEKMVAELDEEYPNKSSGVALGSYVSHAIGLSRSHQDVYIAEEKVVFHHNRSVERDQSIVDVELHSLCLRSFGESENEP